MNRERLPGFQPDKIYWGVIPGRAGLPSHVWGTFQGISDWGLPLEAHPQKAAAQISASKTRGIAARNPSINDRVARLEGLFLPVTEYLRDNELFIEKDL